jgi:hypothetical protein
MHSDDVQLLLAHLRRSVRNFALYEAVASGAVTAVVFSPRGGGSRRSFGVSVKHCVHFRVRRSVFFPRHKLQAQVGEIHNLP